MRTRSPPMLAAIEVIGETVVATSRVPGALEASPVDALDEQAESAAMPRDAVAMSVTSRFMAAA